MDDDWGYPYLWKSPYHYRIYIKYHYRFLQSLSRIMGAGDSKFPSPYHIIMNHVINHHYSCAPAGSAPHPQDPAPARLRSRSRRNGPRRGRWGSQASQEESMEKSMEKMDKYGDVWWICGISWEFMARLRPSYADFDGISWQFWSDFQGLSGEKTVRW